MSIELHKILKKCKYQNHGNTWGGYLTPTEIITLINSGYKPCNQNDNDLETAKQMKLNGKSNPRWFYFVRNKRGGIWI